MKRYDFDKSNNLIQQMGIYPKIATDRIHYITFKAQGMGGKTDLIDSNTKAQRGVCSFEGNKLNAGKYFVMNKIRVLAETTATEIKDAKWNDALHTALLNSELVLWQDEEMMKIPFSVLTAKQNTLKENQGFYDISASAVIVPDKVFRLEIQFPEVSGAAVPNDANMLVRIEFEGFEYTT